MKKSRLFELMKKNMPIVLTLGGVLLVVVIAAAISGRKSDSPEEQTPIDINEIEEAQKRTPTVTPANSDNSVKMPTATPGGTKPTEAPSINITDGDSAQADDTSTDDELWRIDLGEIEIPDNTDNVAEIPDTTGDDENSAVTENNEVAKNDDTDTEKHLDEVGSYMENENDSVEVSADDIIAKLSFDSSQGLSWPVRGDILLNYSIDHLIYHATLNSFRTNPAIIIGCEAGTEVAAAANGVITEITNTAQTGTTVKMTIGNDYYLVYGQLESCVFGVGDYVECGQTIGVTAKTSRYYSAEGDNLYFQVFNGSETVNPMLLLVPLY